MDKYNIRFSPTQNKIIIPHYDINGRLVGIRGRALNIEEVEKYEIKEIYIAIASLSPSEKRNLINICKENRKPLAERAVNIIYACGFHILSRYFIA